MTTIPLPAEYTPRAWVATKVLVAQGDTTLDADRDPEARAAVGYVQLTPLDWGRETATAIVGHEPIICKINADGVMCDPAGAANVKLWAGPWRADFFVDDVRISPREFVLTAAHTEAAPLQLSTVPADAPVVPLSGPGATIMRGEASTVPGPEGPEGPYGGTVVTDPQVASLVATPEGATRTALEDLIDTRAITRPAGGTTTDGVVIVSGSVVVPENIGTSVIIGGAPNYENAIGVNPNTVNTPTPNRTAVPLTAPDGNWNTILGGYDNVVNGWANQVQSYHSIVEAGGNHGTIGGGSLHRIAATSSYGTIGGGTGNVVAGNGGVVAGGTGNTASGNYAVVGGGQGNTAPGPAALVLGGSANTASGTQATVIGGAQNTAAGDYSVAGGLLTTASGLGSATSGRNTEARADYSSAGGRQAVATNRGEVAHAGGAFAVAGDAQTSVIVIKRATTNATPADMQCEGGSPPLIPENATWAFTALIVARQVGGAASAAWQVTGLLQRGTGSTAALIGTPVVTPISATGGLGWSVTVATYSTGYLRFVVTGDATPVRWVARMETAQVADTP